MRTVVLPDHQRHSSTFTVIRTLSVLALALSFTACGGDSSGSNGNDLGRHRDGATEIVLMGTSHFAGSLTDESSSEVSDILSETRQAELEKVADPIAEWGPDGFFLECTPDAQSTLDSLYSAYRTGHFNPTAEGVRNEIHQLGLRAADRSGLKQVRCVDADGMWLGSQAQQVAKKHNPSLLAGLDSLDRERLDDAAYLADHTLREYLLEMNTDRSLWENQKAYVYYYARMGSFDGSGVKNHREGDLGGQVFAFADDVPSSIKKRAADQLPSLNGKVAETTDSAPDYIVLGRREAGKMESGPETGADTVSVRGFNDIVQQNSTAYVGFPDHHIGADLVGEWYKRNLRTYANIWRAVEAGDERVIVLIGQGHVWSLRTFFRENPDFEVVPAEKVL